MAESYNVLQKRVYELEIFEPLTPADPGYEDPALIWIPVDKVTWPEAKRINLIEFIANLHKEQGPVTNVNSVHVSEVFDTAFNSPNYYLKVDAYKIVDYGYGAIIQYVPYKNLTKTTLGFTLELEEYDQTVIVTYIAFE